VHYPACCLARYVNLRHERLAVRDARAGLVLENNTFEPVGAPPRCRPTRRQELRVDHQERVPAQFGVICGSDTGVIGTDSQLGNLGITTGGLLTSSSPTKDAAETPGPSDYCTGA
jgi:hypothetical protein